MSTILSPTSEHAQALYLEFTAAGHKPSVAIDRTAKRLKTNAAHVRTLLHQAGQEVPATLFGFARNKALGIPNPSEKRKKPTVQKAKAPKPIGPTPRILPMPPKSKATYTDPENLPAWYLEQRSQPARFMSAKEIFGGGR